MAQTPKNQNLDPDRYVYRLMFTKVGTAKFISHLDLVRVMQRSFKRAKLPIWYTQGFNPRQYLMFPLPLSLGIESETEFMDIALLELLQPEDICSRLNLVLPEGIKILSAGAPVHEHTDIEKSDYTIRITVSVPAEEAVEKLRDFFSADKIQIMKRVKPKKNRREEFKEMDVRQYVQLMDISIDGDETVLSLRLAASAGNGFNLNFAPLLEAFSAETKIEILSFSAKRTKILCKNGENFS